MSLKSKIEAVIYASEEPVTLQQLAGLLGEEAQAELDAAASQQAELPIDSPEDEAGQDQEGLEASPDALPEAAVGQDEPAAERTEEPASHEEAGSETEFRALSAALGETAAEQAVSPEAERRIQRERERQVRDHIRRAVDQLVREYAENDRGIEIREVANGFRMGTKPEYHDAVRGFVKSLKPALKLTLPALETLAVVAYKQPVTAAEISEIRGVDSAGVLGGLMSRKLIATAGRKQVIGRPMLYKTTKDFLLRFGLKDVSELPSMEEFERMAGELAEQDELPIENTDAVIEQANARGDAERIREVAGDAATEAAEGGAEAGAEAGQTPSAETDGAIAAPAESEAPHPDGE